MNTPVESLQEVDKQNEKETQQNVDQNITQNQENAKPIVNNQTETQEDPNWRAFREARKKDRADKEAAERRAAEKEAEAAALKAAMEAAFAKEQRQYGQQYQNDYQEETEDEKIEKKVQAALAAREVEYEKQRMERERQEAPRKILQTYPDFSHVVSQENCDYIDFHYPELSAPFQHMPEGYEKWSAMYKLIKKFVPNATTAKKEMAKAETNFMKPKSMSATGFTQLPQDTMGSARLSEERKASNWERMQRTLKGIG